MDDNFLPSNFNMPARLVAMFRNYFVVFDRKYENFCFDLALALIFYANNLKLIAYGRGCLMLGLMRSSFTLKLVPKLEKVVIF